MKLLPGVAIYGKNGGGKSNVIRAFWLGVQFIRNAQRMQHEKASVPVVPFAATREKIVKESLYHAPKGQKAQVFVREGQKFSFTEEKARRKLISETVAENQLFFSVACTMNDSICVNAMKWFREDIFFSRDYTDISRQLLEYYDDSNMLKAISDYAKTADFGIEEMQFEVENKEIGDNLESDGTRRLMSIAPAIESVLNKGGIMARKKIGSRDSLMFMKRLSFWIP